MAKAITNIEKHIPNQAEEQDQAIQQLVKAAANDHQPLLKFLDILNEMDRLGVLDAARGMLKNSEQIAFIGINQMNKPGAHRIIKNGMGAMQFLSRLDPAKLQLMMNGLASGVDLAADNVSEKKKSGIWGLLKSMREPEVRSSLSMMTGFLKGMGSGMNRK